MANWKMNLGVAGSVQLARAIQLKGKQGLARVELVVFPSFVALPAVGQVLKPSLVQLGAQDLFWAEQGNFTGEVSPSQLREAGCTWTLVGHSERREHLNETDEMVERKTSAALKFGLTPVLCVGETRDDRRAGRSELYVGNQVRSAIRYLRPPFPGQRLVVAYEPRWAISPGLPCKPSDAKAMASVIRQALIDRYDTVRAYENCTIVYGGSADASNICDYLDSSEIDGALVGNASLSIEMLLPLLRAVAGACQAEPPVARPRPRRTRRA